MNCQFAITFADGAERSISEAASVEAFRKIDDIERLLSTFNDTSDVAVIRSLKPGEVAVVAPETMAVILESVNVCAATQGAFDPSLAPVMKLLRDNGMNWENISKEDFEDAFARCGMQRLVIDIEHTRISVTEDKLGRPTPVELDFGGIGKGFALDECKKVIKGEQFEITDFMIDAGSSTVLASGTIPQKLGVGGKWKSRSKNKAYIEIKNGALSASGFEAQGQHVINPRKCEAASSWEHAWVIAPNATIADALSTAVLSMSEKEIANAAKELRSDILIARKQSPIFDKLRDPLKWIKGLAA